MKTCTSTEQYQKERGKVDSEYFPVPGGSDQHRKLTRAYLKLLEKVTK